MGLEKVNQVVVSSDVAHVNLTGIDTNDVYLVAIRGMTSDNDGNQMRTRVLKGGGTSADTTSNYDLAGEEIKAHTSFGTLGRTNDSYWRADFNTGNVAGEELQMIMYLHNWYKSDEYSYLTFESSFLSTTNDFYANAGGMVHTVTSSSTGIQFYFGDAVNHLVGAGTFTLYKITGA
tara:strand:+ start:1104 stop:1631 length:528 start_codon:yes stop_codon:yes gene_type:complete